WLRGRFTTSDEELRVPALPPITHIMLNTVNAVNLHTVRTERFSGQGIPNQEISLLKKPLFLHRLESGRNLFPRIDRFRDIRILVEHEGRKEEWREVSDSEMLVCTKDDKVFTVDTVEGILRFGNGIRGAMLPVGSNNIVVDVYRTVPGAKGNVSPGAVNVCDFNGILDVVNLLPANGGKDAETVDEIIRRAPSLLTTRDRAVTKIDFEVIAKEASAEVARAACLGLMKEDGDVSIVILPNRREGERIPNNFLSGGLRDHVSAYLKRRCLINVNPVVRLAEFRSLDISLTLRLRPNSNIILVREEAEKWILNFLDPYTGGLDREGWPFGGTLYAQDLARMVTDIADVRHVTLVELFDGSKEDARGNPGWETRLGDGEISLEDHDLFVVRRIRVRIEEGY
ncbi:MAG: baseplate J/gp47 family protein, partial [Myxococcota bacterium]|nr:baseplate J/gp47 family protein [Myxococcota bacterium]